MIEPGLRQQNPRRHQRNTRLQPEPLRGAAPRPVLRLADESPGDRPPFDHDATPHQRATGQQRRDRHRHRMFSAAGGGRPAGSSYPFDQVAEHLRSPRRHHEIPGVREQAERQQLHMVHSQEIAQVPEQHSVVPRSLQLRVRGHQGAGDVKVADSGERVGHRIVSSGPGQRQARCQVRAGSVAAETCP